MATLRIFNVHRTWEDWLGICLGVLIGLAPAFTGQTDNQAILYNAIIVGLLVVMLAAVEFVDLHRWEEYAETLCGLWLIASPFIFGYAAAGTLRYWHFVLGALVVALAVLELWQDWRLSDKELARHGR